MGYRPNMSFVTVEVEDAVGCQLTNPTVSYPTGNQPDFLRNFGLYSTAEAAKMRRFLLIIKFVSVHFTS